MYIIPLEMKAKTTKSYVLCVPYMPIYVQRRPLIYPSSAGRPSGVFIPISSFISSSSFIQMVKVTICSPFTTSVLSPAGTVAVIVITASMTTGVAVSTPRVEAKGNTDESGPVELARREVIGSADVV
jgi:hypothetical protein